MIRTPLLAVKSVVFALLFGAAAVSSTSAYALPHFGVHRHPANVNDCRVSMVLFNKSASFRDVKIDGHVYTLMPHDNLTLKAPVGTPVYLESTGAMHHKGDLLFAVSRTMQNKWIPIS